jgi:membrane-bound serine protease (ClpP class)
LARQLTHPIVSSLLLTFGFLGIIYELKIPGWGISGTIGLVCLALFFGAHLLVGLAEWMELLLFAAGIALIVAEVFFIPGFGIAGISGIVCLMLAVYLALVKSPIPRTQDEIEQFRRAMYTLCWFIVAMPGVLILTWKLLPRTPFYARIVQVAEERADLGFTAGSTESYTGKVGRTVTILRPAGRARFEGRLVDVVAEGEFIPPNTQVRVVDVKGNRVVVIPDEEAKES